MANRLSRDVLFKHLGVEFKDCGCSCAATDEAGELYAAFQRTVKRFGLDTAPAVPAAAKAQDRAGVLDAAAEFQRFENTVRRSRFTLTNPPLADALPRPQREALAQLMAWGAKALRVEEPELVLYRRDPDDARLGFFRPDEPGRIWVAAEPGRTGEDICLTALHELAHASGADEPAARRVANELARRWSGV